MSQTKEEIKGILEGLQKGQVVSFEYEEVKGVHDPCLKGWKGYPISFQEGGRPCAWAHNNAKFVNLLPDWYGTWVVFDCAIILGPSIKKITVS